MIAPLCNSVRTADLGEGLRYMSAMMLLGRDGDLLVVVLSVPYGSFGPSAARVLERFREVLFS